MENRIFQIRECKFKSLVLVENEIWVSSFTKKSLDKFSDGVKVTGIMKGAFSIPLASLYEVNFKSEDEFVSFRYISEKGNKKRLKFNIGDSKIADEFGDYLGSKLGLFRSEENESRIWPLLFNALFLVGAVVITVRFGFLDVDISSFANDAHYRYKGAAEIMQMLMETLGKSGVSIIGSLGSFYLIYGLYKRFTNPKVEVFYRK